MHIGILFWLHNLSLYKNDSMYITLENNKQQLKNKTFFLQNKDNAMSHLLLL